MTPALPLSTKSESGRVPLAQVLAVFAGNGL